MQVATFEFSSTNRSLYVIGASLSEPHLVRTTPALSIYIYIYKCLKNALRLDFCEGKKFDTLKSCRIPWYTSISATHSTARALQRPRCCTHGEGKREALSMEVTHGRRTSSIEASRASTGRVGRRRHTFESIDGQATGESESCSSTCTCSAIHHPVGDRGCSGEDRICNWTARGAGQKAACGVIAHSIRVKWGQKVKHN